MFDYETKVDNISVFPASSFNNMALELENAVTNSGLTLDTLGTPTSVEMLAQSITRASQGGSSYQDSGSANSYVLTSIGGFKQPSAYFDGMTVTFSVGNANTGSSTVNVSSLGVKNLVDNSGVALASGSLIQDNFVTITYDATNDYFKLLNTNGGVDKAGSIVTNGYQTMDNGLIIQWGTVSYASATGTRTVNGTWPIAFPNNIFIAMPSLLGTGSDDIATMASYDVTSFQGTVRDNTGSTVQAGNFNFIAIGN